ncbi:Uncharacterised protein [Mycobacteroides abscessus subsp. abscessus]|uniref:hypothetical protein n=1 Tax=Mycobacteroides abscessus TaxID=36809 RepID=UPI0009C895EF|nr:hypothetical protein [Mycobacteroides abscessus]MBN7355520.1 hypothetical protein [Mycobacteroides abscessus subsp. abscessus]MBN7360299.1 hypothetical protein [Mycobacteroides abscessus subsp. abscessus]MBN7476888.1 hypothetical protein [Mycobacteroides abscessus subsp. abscessus]QOF29687.1 hypothetical protein E3G43_003247 [Mycobacteroides abscessus]SLI66513.1 Uncharacterised protein [Mycobacteroides abscessus subsp. abscessus]
MATFWIAVATAAVTAFVSATPPSVIAYLKHRRLVQLEKQRDELMRDNEFQSRQEAALTRALSDDPTQRDIGLANLVELRDGSLSTPERSARVQTHIDRVKLTMLGKLTIGLADFSEANLDRRPSPPVTTFGDTPFDLAVREFMAIADERERQLTDRIRESNRRLRRMGLNLINGSTDPDGIVPVPDVVKKLRAQGDH